MLSEEKHLYAGQTRTLPGPLVAEAETLRCAQGDRCAEASELEERIADNVARLLE